MQRVIDTVQYLTDRRNYTLDLFRILAVLMVLSVHVRGYLNGIPTLINEIFGLGAYGVALYFLLSGYFSYSSVKKYNTTREYLWNKMVRIIPMYYVSLILTFLIGTIITKEFPIDWKWIYHVFFLNMFIPGKEWSWWNSVNFFWTMPAFIAWYLISPVLFKAAKNRRGVLLVTVISVVWVPFLKQWLYAISNKQFGDWNFFSLLYVFMFGVLAYFSIKEKRYWLGMLEGIIIGILAIIIGNRSGFLVFGLFFYELVLIADVLRIKIRSQRLQKVIKFLSNITYSIYLTHWFVLKFVQVYGPNIPWWLAYISFVAIAGVVGAIFYEVVEKKAAKALTKMIQKRNSMSIQKRAA